MKTNVRRGENGGKTLDHVSVVREMKLLGNLASADKTFESETALSFNSAWKKVNLKFVVFVQGKDSKKIFGVRRFENKRPARRKRRQNPGPVSDTHLTLPTRCSGGSR